MQHKSFFTTVTLLLAAALLAGCGGGTPTPAPTKSIEHIRLPMGYIPNVQYAPFYVAVDKGYFAREGIEIEFDYKPETDGIKLVGGGQLSFAIVSGEQVPLARAQGLPVTYMFQWWQKFPVGIAALSEKGIKTPADLVGKRVATPALFGASYIGWRGLVFKAGLDESKITLDNVGFGRQIAALTEGKADAAIIYVNNEPIQLRRAGKTVDVIAISDYANLVSNGVVTNQDTIARRPELAAAFARALKQGIADAIASPEAAFEICKKYVTGLDDPDIAAAQMEVLKASIEMWKTDQIGRSDPASWQTTIDVLKEAGLLTSDVDVNEVFTNQFIK